MNTITIELCKEDRKRLDDILTALAVAILKPEEVSKARAELAAETKEAQKEELAVESPVSPSVTRADIQQLVVELSAAGKKGEVKDIITAYAPRVSGIPEDKFVEVWQKLSSIEG